MTTVLAKLSCRPVPSASTAQESGTSFSVADTFEDAARLLQMASLLSQHAPSDLQPAVTVKILSPSSLPTAWIPGHVLALCFDCSHWASSILTSQTEEKGFFFNFKIKPFKAMKRPFQIRL